MKKFETVQNLKALVERSKKWSCPMLVKMNTRAGSLDFLVDRVIDKVMTAKNNHLKYVQLDAASSVRIIDELQVMSNPVIVLFYKGEIMAIFSGIIAQYQLEKAIEDFGKNNKCKKVS